jgi:hypothetical protein
MEVCLRAGSEVFGVFRLLFLLFCLSLVFVCFLLPLELLPMNVQHHHVLTVMRLDVATESERFICEKSGSFGNEVGFCPMAKSQRIDISFKSETGT